MSNTIQEFIFGKKKTFTLLILLIFSAEILFSQTVNLPSQNFPKPKLVIGIVVDQMRYDLLWHFWDQYGNGGFKRLVNEGFLCRDARFNYFLTVTATGHSSIYCGTTPSIHGVVDNFYFDRQSNKTVYVMTDTSVKTVGNPTNSTGVSPLR